MPTDRTQARKASQIYADALLEAAKPDGQSAIFALSNELDQLRDTVIGNIDLRNTLADRTVPAEARKAIVNEVFAGFNPVLLAIVGVAVERNDVALLPRIAENYLLAAEQHLGATIIDVTTAVPLDDGLRGQIKTKYSAQLSSDVFLREHIDASIIGGIVLSTHGRRIDASVASQLQSARAVLSTSKRR